jgi:hypothetical protein
MGRRLLCQAQTLNTLFGPIPKKEKTQICALGEMACRACERAQRANRHKDELHRRREEDMTVEVKIGARHLPCTIVSDGVCKHCGDLIVWATRTTGCELFPSFANHRPPRGATHETK